MAIPFLWYLNRPLRYMVLNMVILLIKLTPIFEWYMTRLVLKNKDMRYNKLGLNVENIGSFLGLSQLQ